MNIALSSSAYVWIFGGGVEQNLSVAPLVAPESQSDPIWVILSEWWYLETSAYSTEHAWSTLMSPIIV